MRQLRLLNQGGHHHHHQHLLKFTKKTKVFSRFFNLHLTSSYFAWGKLYVHAECTNRYRSSLHHSKMFFSFFFSCWFSTFWSRRGNKTTISLTCIEGSSNLHFLLQKPNKQAKKKTPLKHLRLNSMMKQNKTSWPWVLKPGIPPASNQSLSPN